MSTDDYVLDPASGELVHRSQWRGVIPTEDPGYGAQFIMNRTMIAWKALIVDYDTAAADAGRKEADYRSQRAKEIRTLILDDPKLPVSKAEYIADGSDDVRRMLLERMLADMNLDAMKQKIKWLDNEVSRLRTIVVSEREERKLDATGGQPG